MEAYTHEDEIENKANEFSEKYLNEHKQTAKESFLAGVKYAYKLTDYLIFQHETAFEVANNERKEFRDKMDIANAEVAKLKHGGRRKGAGART